MCLYSFVQSKFCSLAKVLAEEILMVASGSAVLLLQSNYILKGSIDATKPEISSCLCLSPSSTLAQSRVFVFPALGRGVCPARSPRHNTV